MWEIFIGSPVVNVCLSSKYVLACSIDGTLRFLDIQTGILVLPIVKLPTAAVQCSFVRDRYNQITNLFTHNFSICAEFQWWTGRCRNWMWYSTHLEHYRTMHLSVGVVLRHPRRFLRGQFSHQRSWYCICTVVKQLLILLQQETRKLVCATGT